MVVVLALGESIELEGIRAGLAVITAAFALALGWFVGQRLSVQWAIRQKRRELELAAAAQFYALYGEFFAVWKLWNDLFDHPRSDGPGHGGRSDLMTRACAAEAGVEAILVKLSTERKLSSDDVMALGKFRQAYQTLRESIAEGQPIKWLSSDQPEYLTFKDLACYVATMLSSSASIRTTPRQLQASVALRKITSNEWEERWVEPFEVGPSS